MLRPQDLTEEMIRDLRDRVMGGSPLYEYCLVALGDLILDDGDPDVNIEDARDQRPQRPQQGGEVMPARAHRRSARSKDRTAVMSPADSDRLVLIRALRLGRLFLAGRKPIADARKRHAHHQRTDRATGLLVRAVEEHDAAWARHAERMARWRVASERATRAAETRKRNKVATRERKETGRG